VLVKNRFSKLHHEKSKKGEAQDGNRKSCRRRSAEERLHEKTHLNMNLGSEEEVNNFLMNFQLSESLTATFAVGDGEGTETIRQPKN
jgi:hypothetical protein